MSQAKSTRETKSYVGKSVPSESLIFLAHDGSNSMKWRKALHEYFGAEYGIIGHFLEDGAYYDRPAWDAAQWQQYQAMHGLTNIELSKHRSAKAQSHQAKLEEDLNDYSKMYARVMQTLTEDQKSLIKQQATWVPIRNARMPLALIELAQSTIVNQTAGLPIAEQLDTALRRYMNLKQYAWESADAYSERAQELVGQLARLRHPSAPDEPTAVRHAIHGLLTPKYDQYKINLLNETRSGVRQYPDTWTTFVTAVCQWINPIRASTVSNRYVYACSVCNKSGHEEPNCFVAHPELKSKYKKSSNSSPSSTYTPATATASAVGSKDLTAEGGTLKKGASLKKKSKGKRKAGDHVTAYSTSVVEDDNVCRELWGFPTVIHCATTRTLSDRIVEHPRAVSIDTFADLSFVHESALLDSIRDASFIVHGVSGSGRGQHMGTLACFGDAAVIIDSKVNALAAWQAQLFPNTVIPGVSWTIHLPHGIDLVFDWNQQCKSYTCIFSDEILSALQTIEVPPSAADNGNTAMAATMSEVERSVPRRELLRAKGARELQGRLYYPSDLSLIRTLTGGSMLNSEVTGADVKLARDLFGPDENVIAGKSKNAGPVAPSEVLVPTFMRKEQTAYADMFYWRGVPFLVFIIKPMYLLMGRIVPAGTNNSDQLAIEIKALLIKVEARGYKIISVVVDPAKPLAKIADSGIVPGMTVVGAGGHVPDAEVEIRVIEERCRCMEASLSVPVALCLVKWLVYGALQSRNVVLRPHQTVTSREAFTGIKYDVKRDVRAKFLDYAQAFRTPEKSNGSEPRTVSAVYLISTGNREGSVYMYDLTTERVFSCDRFTLLPMPDLAVSKLIQLWTRDEPTSKRKRRAAWKLARGLRGAETPIAENFVDEDEAIRDVVVVPTTRDIVSDVDYPVIDLVASGGIEEPILQGTDALAAGFDHREHVFDSIESTLNSRGEEPFESRHTGGVEPPELVTSMESESDDFLPNVGSSDDLRANEDDTVLSVDPASTANVRRHNLRRSARVASRRVDVHTLRAYRMSLNKALKLQKTSTRDAVMKELEQILNKKVWTYVEWNKLSNSQVKKVIRSLMFLKEKVDATGKFVKMKARLVAGGDGQDKTIYDNISSPTVCLESVMTILAIAAILRRKIATVDITGAYLECELPDTDEVLMRLDPVVTRLLHELDLSAVPFQLPDGTTVVKLKRALYGCVQSARLWFEKLRDTLELNGFVSNSYDLCVFNKIVDGHQCTICFHVDDLLITCGSDAIIDGVVNDLGKTFAGVSVTRGATHSYLGMGVTVCNCGINVDMSGYLKKILDERTSIGRVATSPATENLLDHDDSAVLLNEVDQKLFHSDVAKILFIAKRVRMMTLTAVSVLASRVNIATCQDREKLNRVFSYLAYSRDIVMKFKCGGAIDFEVYVDASWATHMDGHGRTGIVIMMAGCAIAAWTCKQKMVTRSSTEAEIVALSDALSHVMWLRRWIAAQGHILGATVVYQDNEAVMKLMRSDRRTHQRTKHLDVRYFYARDLESEGAIRLKWIPTADMIADLMTKPVTGSLFEKLNAKLMGAG